MCTTYAKSKLYTLIPIACMNLSQGKNLGKTTSSIFHSARSFHATPPVKHPGCVSYSSKERRQHSVLNEPLRAATSSLSAGGSIHPSITRFYCLVHTEEKRDASYIWVFLCLHQLEKMQINILQLIYCWQHDQTNHYFHYWLSSHLFN